MTLDTGTLRLTDALVDLAATTVTAREVEGLLRVALASQPC